MLRPDSSRFDPDDGINNQDESSEIGSGSINIQQELNRLEEMILDSPRIPLTGWTLVDEEQLLDQLDLVRLNLPEAFREAEGIIRYKEDIYQQAEEYGIAIVEQAERRAEQIVDELGIIRQAEREAQMIRQKVQEECDAIQQETLAQIERMRQQAQQELEQMRQRVLSECTEIQTGADEYADKVLKNIEYQLNEMMRVIRNGRQQLNRNEALPPARNRETDGSNPLNRTSNNSPRK